MKYWRKSKANTENKWFKNITRSRELSELISSLKIRRAISISCRPCGITARGRPSTKFQGLMMGRINRLLDFRESSLGSVLSLRESKGERERKEARCIIVLNKSSSLIASAYWLFKNSLISPIFTKDDSIVLEQIDYEETAINILLKEAHKKSSKNW